MDNNVRALHPDATPHSHEQYADDVLALVARVEVARHQLGLIANDIRPTVLHKGTRDATILTLEAADTMLTGVVKLLNEEAQS